MIFKNPVLTPMYLIALGLYLSLGVAVSSKAQTNGNSIRIIGKLAWKDSSILGFPKKLKILSNYNPLFVSSAEVDSLGNYSVTLPIDSYVIAPAVKYHFNDSNGFIRIDDTKSKLFVVLDKDTNGPITIPLLEIDTIVKPNFTRQEGILHRAHDANVSKMIDEFVEANMLHYQVPGASLAIFKKGKVIHQNVYGFKNLITKEPVNENTLFEAGSITKPIFALAVLRLVEKGIIDLDRPLYQYLEFEDISHDKRYELMTARHVLSHQSGLPNWAKRNKQNQFDLLFKPGTKYGYSGEGFEYLKRVVEEVTKEKIETILKTEVLDVIDWNNVHFKTTDRVRQNITNGQNLSGFPSKNSQVKTPMMAYSMVVEASSFANFALAMRNNEILNLETYKEMMKIHSNVEKGVNWGLGLRLDETDYGMAYGHSGYMPSSGFTCNYIFFPDLDMGYAIFTNSTTGWWLSNVLLKEFLITGIND